MTTPTGAPTWRVRLAVALINTACRPFNHLIERYERRLNGDTT